MTSNVDPNKALAHNTSRFKQISEELSDGFLIDDHNKKPIELILLYISRHPDFLKTDLIHNPNLDKGLSLVGNVGSGKTLLLSIISKLLRFGIISCREISEKCQSEGKKELTLYGRNSFKRGVNNIRDLKQPITRGFDDLGAEEIANFYGNKIDPMGEIIQDRYDMFVKYGLTTRITTNFNGNGIEERYGPRVRSRIRQMFNQIIVTGPDRRK